MSKLMQHDPAAETVVSGVFSCDLKTQIIQFSSGMFELLKCSSETLVWSLDQLRAMILDDTISATDLSYFIERGIPFDQECRVTLQNGKVSWIATHFEIIRDASGVAVKLIGVSFDATHKHSIQRCL